jgi:predicted RNase H-like HicB family nuclease
MATFDISINNGIMKVDAETLEEALQEAEDILAQFLVSWETLEA